MLGGATLTSVPGGMEVNQLGALSRSGGGTALVAAALKLVEDRGGCLLAAFPLDHEAAQFWAQAGLWAMPLPGCKLRWFVFTPATRGAGRHRY